MKFRQFFIIVVILSAQVLSACNLPTVTSIPTDQMDEIRTVAAQTAEAMITQIYASQSAPTLPPVPPVTQPTLNPTAVPSATPQPVTPTVFPYNISTETLPCDRAEFVSETIPDGSQFFPGSGFTKTWTLRNAGSCTWTSDYEVEYTTGDIPNIGTYQKLFTSSVAPGATVTISMDLTAPETPGNYRANFKLRNASGTTFPDTTFWADIEVITGTNNLVDNYCAADWTSGAGTLPCPGKASDAAGYVYSDPTPVLENGYQDDETALWLAPQSIDNGYIQGIFPARIIPSGAKFEAIIGCKNNAASCDTVISLNYQEGTNAMQTLAQWNETNDNAYQKVSVDLSALAGKNIRLILIVDSHGSYQGDKVHILQPKISQ
ncbi:MAG: NBR1-Ig-like domain-containing protein [Anaerolineaceae bacterium]